MSPKQPPPEQTQAPKSIMQMAPYEVEVNMCVQLVKRYILWTKHADRGDEAAREKLRIWGDHYDKCLGVLQREGIVKPGKKK